MYYPYGYPDGVIYISIDPLWTLYAIGLVWWVGSAMYNRQNPLQAFLHYNLWILSKIFLLTAKLFSFLGTKTTPGPKKKRRR